MRRRVRVDDVRIGNVLDLPFTDNANRPCRVVAIRHFEHTGLNVGYELHLHGAGGDWQACYAGNTELIELCPGGWDHTDHELDLANRGIDRGRQTIADGMQLGPLPIPSGDRCFVIAGMLTLPRWRTEWGNVHSRAHYRDATVQQLEVGHVFQFLRENGMRSGALQVVSRRTIVIADTPAIHLISVATIHGRDRGGRMLVCDAATPICMRGDYTPAVDVSRAGRCTTAVVSPPTSRQPVTPESMQSVNFITPNLRRESIFAAGRLRCGGGIQDDSVARVVVVEFTPTSITNILRRIGLSVFFSGDDLFTGASFSCDDCVAYYRRAEASDLSITRQDTTAWASLDRFRRRLDDWLLLPERFTTTSRVSSYEPEMVVTPDGVRFQLSLDRSAWFTTEISTAQLYAYGRIMVDRDTTGEYSANMSQQSSAPQRPVPPVDRRRVVVLDTPAAGGTRE